MAGNKVVKVLSPVIISNVVTYKQNFSHFVVMMRKKGSTNIVEKNSGGIMVYGKTRMIPVVFYDTVKGLTYQYSVLVVNQSGNRSVHTDWVDIVAGDNTPPDNISSEYINVNQTALGISLSISSSYSRPLDLKGFQWVLKNEDVEPLDTDDIMEPVLSEYITQYPGSTSSLTLYIWVRAIDKGNNTSDWTKTTFNLDTENTGGVFVLKDVVVMG